MTTDSRESRINEANNTWPDSQRADLVDLIDRAEDLCRKTVEDFNADPTAAYSAAQAEYGCDWRWVAGEDEPTIRVSDCDGDTIDTLTTRGD